MNIEANYMENEANYMENKAIYKEEKTNLYTHTHRATWNDGCALISFSLCTLVFSIPYILFQPLGNDI